MKNKKTKLEALKMRKASILKIVIFYIVIGALIGIMFAKGATTAKLKEEIGQILEKRGNHLIEFKTWLIPVEEVIDEAVREYNETADKGDIYTVYQVEKNIYWTSSKNGYQQEISKLNHNLINVSNQIAEGKTLQATIEFIYATEEQKNHYQFSMVIWELYVTERANIQIIEEEKEEVIKVTVILTPRNFVERAVPMVLLLYLATYQNIC